MTSEDIKRALRFKFSAPEWAWFCELRDAAGFQSLRALDFWAIHTWPSKGHLTVAAEVKVTRGDFIRELNNPSKRESAENYARETYFAAPKGLIKPEELPERWGLIEVGEKGNARTTVRAAQREEPHLNLSFIAAVVKRGFEHENTLFKAEDRLAAAREEADRLEAAIEARWSATEKENRERWLGRARKDAETGLLDGHYAKIESIIRAEFGWCGDRDMGANILAFLESAKAGTLSQTDVQEIRTCIAKLQHYIGGAEPAPEPTP